MQVDRQIPSGWAKIGLPAYLHSFQESQAATPSLVEEYSRDKHRDAKLLSRLLLCLATVDAPVPEVLVQ